MAYDAVKLSTTAHSSFPKKFCRSLIVLPLLLTELHCLEHLLAERSEMGHQIVIHDRFSVVVQTPGV